MKQIFGILRRKYHILWGSKFPVTTQVLIITLTSIHNLVRLREGIGADALLNNERDNPKVEDTITPLSVPLPTVNSTGARKMNKLTDEIAKKK